GSGAGAGVGGAGVGGSGGGGGVDCAALSQAVDDRLAEAQACDLLHPNASQCKESEPGKCCAVVVADAGSSATAAYLDALAQWTQAGCTMPCPDAPCSPNPTGTCQAGPSLTQGTCVAN
ncbi:MAG TPA: hypothetical protein VHB21_25970, partial [Minicystis sp.]|nr:hypothetical protein [Minicystis sp.]